MKRTNVLSSLLLISSVAAWLVTLGSADVAPSAFVLLMFSTGILLLTTVAGLLLTQSLWAQRLALGVIALQILPVFLTQRSPSWWVAAAFSVATVFVVGGPLTATRVGLLATAPPKSAALLMLISISVPMALALINLQGEPSVATWVVAVASVGLAWLFGKVSLVALWLLRTGLPLAIVALTFNGPWPQALLLVAVGVGMAWFAWQGETHIATVPLIPTRHHPKPVFAELTPPEVLDSAGLDSRGRRA